MRAFHSDFGAKSTANSGATVATAPAPRPHSTAKPIHVARAEAVEAAPRPRESAAKPPKNTGRKG
jgi:hypothetical protein